MKLTEAEKKIKREEYQYYKQHGICVICHARPAFGRYVRCEYCHEKMIANYKGRTYSEKYKQKVREERARRKANGLCIYCKKPIYKGNNLYCYEHWIQNKNKVKRHSREQRRINREQGFYMRDGVKHFYLSAEEKLAIQRKNAEHARQSQRFKEHLIRMKEREHQRYVAHMAKVGVLDEAE